MYTLMHMQTHAYSILAHICTNRCLRLRKAYIHRYIHIHTHIHTYTYMRTVHKYVHTYLRSYIQYMHTYIIIQTYMHAQTPVLHRHTLYVLSICLSVRLSTCQSVSVSMCANVGMTCHDARPRIWMKHALLQITRSAT